MFTASAGRCQISAHPKISRQGLEYLLLKPCGEGTSAIASRLIGDLAQHVHFEDFECIILDVNDWDVYVTLAALEWNVRKFIGERDGTLCLYYVSEDAGFPALAGIAVAVVKQRHLPCLVRTFRSEADATAAHAAHRAAQVSSESRSRSG